jgi:hypothetical protein
MKNSLIRAFHILIVGFACTVHKASGQVFNFTLNNLAEKVQTLDIPPASQPAESSALSFTFTPYAWFTGISGNIGVGGTEASVDESAGDIVSAVDTVVGVFARGDIRYDPFDFYIDGGYMRMGIGNQGTLLGISNITSEMSIVDFALMYRIGDWPADHSAPGLSLDALIGGRYFHLGNNLQFNFAPSKIQNTDWVDPIIGGEAAINLTKHWRLQFHGDVGGFGVGSKLTWSGVGEIAYGFRIGKSIESSIFAGYKAIGENYASGNGSSKFVFDTVLNGPIVGFSFTF